MVVSIALRTILTIGVTSLFLGAERRFPGRHLVPQVHHYRSRIEAMTSCYNPLP